MAKPVETRAKKLDDQKPSENLLHLIIFRLGEEEYGIPIEQVKEVTITPPISRMPKAPQFIKGVANIRGDIIAVMDLEDRFDIAQRVHEGKPHKYTYTLVTEINDHVIGLIVKEVPQSLMVPVSSIEKAPGVIHDVIVGERYIDRIVKMENSLIIVLDIQKVLNPDELKELSRHKVEQTELPGL